MLSLLSRSKHRVRQQGIALFQVLLMMAIFSILLLSMLAFTQSHQSRVAELLDATTEKLLLYSVSNQLAFDLITQDWFDDSVVPHTAAWNFYNYPIQWPEHRYVKFFSDDQYDSTYALDNISVQLQDVRGLISVHFPGDELIRWLVLNGMAMPVALNMRQQLMDAQKISTGGFAAANYPLLQFSTFTEIAQLPLWQANHIHFLQDVAALSGHDFNIANAPDTLLAALLPKPQFDILQMLRQQGNYSVHRFQELTEISPEEGMTFFPGNTLRLTITASSGRSLVLWVNINSQHSQPLQVTQWYWN